MLSLDPVSVLFGCPQWGTYMELNHHAVLTLERNSLKFCATAVVNLLNMAHLHVMESALLHCGWKACMPDLPSGIPDINVDCERVVTIDTVHVGILCIHSGWPAPNMA